MKKILFLTFYFRPDLCAGSFRNSPLLEELARQGARTGVAVDVFTTVPQRYSTFAQKAPELEESGDVRIERIAVPQHKSGIKDQILTFWKFFSEVIRRVEGREYDLVYASSSRLFTAYLGYRIAKRRGIPLYLDIRDIFVDTINEVVKNHVVKAGILPVLRRIERRIFAYAAHINLISEGFRPYFAKFGKASTTCFTNGIDEVFIRAALDAGPRRAAAGPRRVVYAGNMGDGQGLHKVVPQAAKLLGDAYEFRLIGDGGARKILAERIREYGVGNVVIRDPVSREALIREYLEADYLFIHLNDYEAFKKVLPSKVFELGVFPKPILAGVGGHARDFMERHLPGTLLFAPGDYEDMVRQLKSDHGARPIPDRDGFVGAFRRDAINARMAESILSYVK